MIYIQHLVIQKEYRLHLGIKLEEMTYIRHLVIQKEYRLHLGIKLKEMMYIQHLVIPKGYRQTIHSRLADVSCVDLYMFLSRRARRLERKIGRTVAAGAAGGVTGAAAASASTKKADNTKSSSVGHTRPNHNTSTPYSGGSSKPPALSDNMSRKKDSSKSEVHNSLSSQTQEMQSTSKRGIIDKKSVSKQPQSEKQNPQRPIVDKAQDKQESKYKERQSNGSATKRAAPVHERPATTPVPVKSDSQAAASKPEQNDQGASCHGDKGAAAVKQDQRACDKITGECENTGCQRIPSGR